jgi:hypothetical protein
MVNHPNRSKRDPARGLVERISGALATVYKCPFCAYSESFRKGLRNPGRGYGLAMGGALHSKVAAHIRVAHPERLL